MFAFIYDKKGRLVSTGENSYIKTHTLQWKYGKETGNDKKVFLHAEIDALLKARSHGLIPHKIFVARYLADGSAALAKPCAACAKAIKDFGIEEIEYTTGSC